MTTALAKEELDYAAIVERVVITGDLSKLSAAERVNYYTATCQTLGLNPLSQPFQYINLNGKLTLYARRDATDQLRKIHQVSIQIASREHINDAYIVTARATNKDGRTDESIGAVSIGNLKGDLLCNAIMKAETKAKRRVTLSICGLGFLDETEIETIPVAETPAATPAFTTSQPALMTSDQKKALKKISDGLTEFDITADQLKRRMFEEFGVYKSSDLTEENAERFVADLADWLNSLEEARAENLKNPPEKGVVPF